MRVRQQNVANRQLVLRHCLEQEIDLVAGIDDDPLACLFTSEDEAVLGKWRDCSSFEDHLFSMRVGPHPHAPSPGGAQPALPPGPSLDPQALLNARGAPPQRALAPRRATRASLQRLARAAG